MQEVWLEGHGLRLRADIVGDPKHPAALFLHGGGQTRHSWRRAAAALAGCGRYTISLDLRGHGESDWARDGDYGMTAFADDLRRVLEQLPPLPLIIGASLGGLTALTAIGETARPVASGLVLVDVTPRINFAGVARIREFMLARPDGYESLEQVADAIADYQPHRERRRSTAGLDRNLRRNAEGRYFWHWDPRFMVMTLADMAANERRFEAAARHLSIPTILVRGALSDVVDEESLRHFEQLMPDARVVTIERAAHMVAGDRNDAFTDAIIEFAGQ